MVKSSQHCKGRSLAKNSITITTDASKIGGHINSQLYQGIWTKNGSSTTHQYAGIRGSVSYNSLFSSSTSESERSVEMRQYHSGIVYQQVCQSVLQSMGTVQNDNRSWHTDQSGSFIGASQHVGRPTVTSHNSTNRMDSEKSGSEQISLSLGETNDRPTCFRGQKQNASFLHMVSFPESIYAVDALSIPWNNMEAYAFSPICLVPKVLEHVSISVPDSINSTSVAKTPLVHKSVTKAHRLSKKTSHTKQSFAATQNNDISSNTRNIQSHCMAAFYRNFKSKGFSKENRKLLTASWRAGTQQNHACKFKKFNSWCSERQKYPYFATLVDCADFFTYLFNSGLQYRTIAGYR